MKRFNLPDPGEGLVEAEIVSWRVAEGDEVKVNDIVVEIETSKSLVELPIPWAGRVHQILVAEGEVVPIGTPVIVIDDGTPDEPAAAAPGGAAAPDAAAPAAGPTEEREPMLVGYGPKDSGPAARRRRRRGGTVEPDESDAEVTASQALADAWQQTEPSRRPDAVSAPHRVVAEAVGDPLPTPGEPVRGSELVLVGGAEHIARAKPPVRKLAKMLGVDLNDVRGSGPNGAISRADVEAAAAMASLASRATVTGPGTEPNYGGGGFMGGGQDSSAFGAGGFGTDYVGDPFADPRQGSSFVNEPPHGRYQTNGERRIPIRGVRKVTAEAMVNSVNTHVHVTEWVTVDVTATMQMVERLRARREFANLRVSPLLVYAKAVCLAMANNPDINASWDDRNMEIVQHGELNLGIAAATPRGLMVPNIKSAQRMSMLDLCRAINSMVQVAKEGRLQPADYAGGTFTITNVGVFGIDSGTPIINGNESAILCMGSIERRPWVVGEGADERVEPRWVTTVSISFDHRLIDGEQGSRFLREVASLLSDPELAMLY
ncbi:dihydrolipoamide acetyltransferase family protein [Propionibacteriaceae bacterium G1746]